MPRLKTTEAIKITQLTKPQQIVGACTLYNGLASAEASGLDTVDCDDVVFVVNVGDIGSGATLDVTIMGSETDDASAASAITDGAFDQITNTTTATMRVGSLLSKNYNRYLFARAVAATGTVNFAITALRGQQNDGVQDNSDDFDIGHNV